jgi:hypothetical protein
MRKPPLRLLAPLRVKSDEKTRILEDLIVHLCCIYIDVNTRGTFRFESRRKLEEIAEGIHCPRPVVADRIHRVRLVELKDRIGENSLEFADIAIDRAVDSAEIDIRESLGSFGEIFSQSTAMSAL